MPWYYGLNNQAIGPVDEATIRNLIATGMLNRDTLIWQVGMTSWQPVSATPLAAALSPTAPPMPPIYAPAPTPQDSPAERVKQINLFFMLWWILLAAGAALCITLVGIVLGLPVMIASAVFCVLLLYKLWCTVQDGRAESTPGKAVGFLFIPFFNLYWQFVAFWGLAKDLNRYAREHGIAAPQANESLALTGCILNCCVLVPHTGVLAAVGGLVVSIIAMKGMCDTAAAIIQSRTIRSP